MAKPSLYKLFPLVSKQTPCMFICSSVYFCFQKMRLPLRSPSDTVKLRQTCTALCSSTPSQSWVHSQSTPDKVWLKWTGKAHLILRYIPTLEKQEDNNAFGREHLTVSLGMSVTGRRQWWRPRLASVAALVKHGLELLVFLSCKVSALTMRSLEWILLAYIMLRVLCGNMKHGAFTHVYIHTRIHTLQKQTS